VATKRFNDPIEPMTLQNMRDNGVAISQKAQKALGLCKTGPHPQKGFGFAATTRQVTVLVVDASAADVLTITAPPPRGFSLHGSMP
jgi:hypothetical protein